MQSALPQTEQPDLGFHSPEAFYKEQDILEHALGREGRKSYDGRGSIFELRFCKHTAVILQQKLRKFLVVQWGRDNHPHAGSWDQMSSELKQLVK